MGIRWVAAVLLCLGCVLLVARVGEWLEKDRRETEVPQVGIAGYDYPADQRSLNPDQITEAVAGNSPSNPWNVAQHWNRKIFLTVRHDDRNRIRLGESWIQYLAGWIYEPLSRPILPDRIANRRAGICSEVGTLLQDRLRQAGITTRFVGLGGHVVLEAKIGEQWQMLDPDYGVASSQSVATLAASAKSRSQPWKRLEADLQTGGFPEGRIEQYRQILLADQNHQLLPPGQPISPRLSLFAQVTGWLSPVLAILMMLFGGILLSYSYRQSGPAITPATPDE